MTTSTCDVSIVLVDDEPFALKVLAKQFANLGYLRVTSFDRADQALEHLRNAEKSVGLVCCDLQMPGMDGIEFTRQLAAMNYDGALVFVTGEDQRTQRSTHRLAEQHGLHVIGAITKPVSVSSLRDVLRLLPTAAKRPVRAPQASMPAARLAEAIRGGELINLYQPKVCLLTGQVSGVETLVRWQHPAEGVISPDRFVPQAEQYGLIGELTSAVLRSALRQGRIWLDQGLDLHIAINVSMDSLGDLRLPEMISDEAADAGFPLTSLVLEVTESRLLRDPLAALDILTRLRLKRIALSIDDFGTGHSSMTQLRELPFDELKIDRGFVHGALADATARAIVDASVGLARDIGLRSVAEGVEDEADWRYVQRAGCDQAQGYFIAKPMPPEGLAAWLRAWAARVPALTSRPPPIDNPQ